jgi:hypothetical protein
MLRSSKWLALFLAFGLLFGPSLAWSEPPQSSGSVTLSPAEYAQILSAMETADKSLSQSNDLIAKQDKALKMQSILCGGLVLALALEGVGLIIVAVHH